MATAGLRTALDDTDSALVTPSGLLPDPLATSTSTDTDSSAAPSHSGNNNFIYIYSFLSTLFLLLCISLVILVRVLLRRRRLEALLNHADSGARNDPDAANVTAHTSAMQQRESRRNRRRKKHQLLGSKPYLSSAWIGSGPLPTSLSTEALLGSIQPFSASLAPPLEEEEAHVNGEKQQHHPQASYQHHQRQQASIPLVDYSAAHLSQSHLLPEEATTHSTSNSISNTNTANKSRLLQLLGLPKSVSISSCTVEEAPSSSSADRPGLALTTSNSMNPSDPSPSSPIPLTPLTNLQPNQFPLSPSPLPPSPSPMTPTTAGGNNLDRVQVEFLIAMPRAPSLRRPRFGNQSTTSFGCPSIFTESESGFGGDARSIGADSSWSCLQDGELPELVVGVSTVQVPMTERGGLDRYTVARRAAMRSERR